MIHQSTKLSYILGLVRWVPPRTREEVWVIQKTDWFNTNTQLKVLHQTKRKHIRFNSSRSQQTRILHIRTQHRMGKTSKSLSNTSNRIWILKSYNWILDHKQIGYSYDCLLESTFTGYLMHCKGWKSVYLYPDRPCFLGCTTIDMKDALVQLMKWASGLVQVGLSEFSPLTYGVSRMPVLQALCYGYFAFSHLVSVACLLYGILPPLCFFNGTPLYPKVSSKCPSEEALFHYTANKTLLLKCCDYKITFRGKRIKY